MEVFSSSQLISKISDYTLIKEEKITNLTKALIFIKKPNILV